MGGVYCPRCQTKVLLEQDGKSCSNCGRVLVVPADEVALAPAAAPAAGPAAGGRRGKAAPKRKRKAAGR